MKTIKILALLLLVTTIGHAQDINVSDVPSAVRNAFSQESTNATDVEWERDMENYKVEFEVNRMDHEIWFDAAGKIIKKEKDITEAELPQVVKNTITSKYNGYRIDDIEMTWLNNTTRFEVELEKGREELKVTFDDKGMVIDERKD